jgi:type IV secretory pathway VirB2 component (pilin)
MHKILFFIFFALLHFNTFADATPRCNVNKECPFGFVCIAGNAELIDSSNGYTAKNVSNKYEYKGFCAATIPLRQACYVHKIITGVFGKAITALAVIMLGLSFIEGKLDIRKLATFFFAIVLLFGSFEVVYFLVNEKHRSCEIINFNVPLGFPPEMEQNSSILIDG